MPVTQGSPTSKNVAAADLSGKQYYAVNLGSGGWNVAAANGRAQGVLLNKPVSGAATQVHTMAGELVNVEIGASQTIAVGDLLAVDAAGAFKEAAATNVVVAVAAEAVTTGAGNRAVITAYWWGGDVGRVA